MRYRNRPAGRDKPSEGRYDRAIGAEHVAEPDGLELRTACATPVQRLSVNLGNPLAGAEISLHGQEYDPNELNSLFGAALGDPNNVPTMKVRTGRDGSFVMKNAYLGSVQVMAKHQLHLPQMVPTTLSEGAETDLGDIRLYRGASIFGVAKDHEGNFLVGGTINLTRKDGTAFFHRSATVDTRGRYRFDGLNAGSYDLAPFPNSNQTTFMFPPDGDVRSIFLNEGQDAEVDLTSTLLKQPERKPGDRR